MDQIESEPYSSELCNGYSIINVVVSCASIIKPFIPNITEAKQQFLDHLERELLIGNEVIFYLQLFLDGSQFRCTENGGEIEYCKV